MKWRNIMTQDELQNRDPKETYSFEARGCTRSYRAEKWKQFHNSNVASTYDETEENSYLFFESEPKNIYDPDAIKVVVGGEMFGTVGYVGREFTLDIKEIMKNCVLYRIDLDAGSKAEEATDTMKLKITYQKEEKEK